MGTQTKSLQETLILLGEIYGMPGNRRLRCEVLFNLAKDVSKGWIVELGAYRGCGALALYYGAQRGKVAPVATVDDWVTKQGWIGEPYGKEDKDILDAVFEDLSANIKVIQGDIYDAAKYWPYGVGLLIWDLGIIEKDPQKFIDAWSKYIIPGGLFVYHDTPQKKLGYDIFEEALLDTGDYEKHHEYIDAGTFILRKKVQ